VAQVRWEGRKKTVDQYKSHRKYPRQRQKHGEGVAQPAHTQGVKDQKEVGKNAFKVEK